VSRFQYILISLTESYVLAHNGQFRDRTTMTSRPSSPLLAPLALSLALCGTASANVLYKWHDLHSGPDALPYGVSLEIELTDSAVASGAVDYAFTCTDAMGCAADAASPVARFLFSGVTPPISYAPRTQPLTYLAMLTLSLTFTPDGLLAGSISANNAESDFAASSGLDHVFRIDSVHSDFGHGGGCDLWGDQCNGATGLMRAVALVDPAPVPEPGVLALAGAALLAALAGSRRTRKPTMDT
jgi:hypothetical protein